MLLCSPLPGHAQSDSSSPMAATVKIIGTRDISEILKEKMRSCSIELQAYKYFEDNPAQWEVCIDLRGNRHATYHRKTGDVYGAKAGECIGRYIYYCV